MLINPTSLAKLGAIESLAANILNVYPDVVVICESCFKPSMPDFIFVINNYKLYRKDRAIRKGGGVAIYVSCLINCHVVMLPNRISDMFELLCISGYTESEGHQLILLFVYHLPRAMYTDTEITNAIMEAIQYLRYT